MNRRTCNLYKALKLAEGSRCLRDNKWRLAYHLMPPVGWMNDPNGLCEYKGVYHIFFQYSPFDTKPGLNYWGHYFTDDFIRYDYVQPALYCDSSLDCHGVYSGSAYTEENEFYLFYTGNVKHEGNFDFIKEGREHNTIVVRSKNGIDFENKIRILKNSDYPDNVTCHVRDPKVWKEDGKYMMVLGARRKDNTGEVLVYSSEDMEKWKEEREISRENLGYMWECPDYYKLGGRYFLAFSPQGMEADGWRFQNIYQSGYIALDKDILSVESLGGFCEFDSGFDFYAPQSFEDSKGRRIMIAWMGLPDLEGLYKNPTEALGWVHALTIPRVLSEKNGRIYQAPAEELKKLRRNKRGGRFSKYVEYTHKGVFEAEIYFDVSSEFKIDIYDGCRFEYDGTFLILKPGRIGCGRGERRYKCENVVKIDIFADKSSLEIFVNDGETVFSSRIYPDEERGRLCIDGIVGSIDLWDMDSFYYNPDKMSLPF